MRHALTGENVERAMGIEKYRFKANNRLNSMYYELRRALRAIIV
jgi:hypothetical protein